MKETIKSLNRLNISIFLHILHVFHGKISGSKMRAGMSSLRAGGFKMRAAARPWHKNARPCAPRHTKKPPKPHGGYQKRRSNICFIAHTALDTAL